jgi:exodeoxyribonuclease VII small subunit
MSSTKATKKESETFEAASARLDELIREMEGGSLPLDQMISAFEEGRKLVAFCNAKLTEVQQRVEKIKEAEEKGTLIREDYQ